MLGHQDSQPRVSMDTGTAEGTLPSGITPSAEGPQQGLKAPGTSSVSVLEARSLYSRCWLSPALLEEQTCSMTFSQLQVVPAILGLQLHHSSLCLQGHMALALWASLHTSLLIRTRVSLGKSTPVRSHLTYISKDPISSKVTFSDTGVQPIYLEDTGQLLTPFNGGCLTAPANSL